MDLENIDVTFLVKWFACTFVFAILPVWFWNIADLSLSMKVMFTIAGGFGVFIALTGKTLRQK